MTMHARTAFVAAGLCLSLGLVADASAGTVGGTITAVAGGAPLAAAEVRIWVRGPKGYSIAATTTANASGGYSFTVAAGTYKVDVRGPAGSNNYGDRWYDVAAPTAGGYVGEVADELVVGAATTTTGIDLALEILGGSDGTVLRAGAVPLANAYVRMERRGEVRIHHNDLTKANPPGLASMRGLVPAADYQLIVYDPTGVRDTLLVPGPYSIASSAVGALGNLTMADAAADPNEGNNTPSCAAVSIDAGRLHADPPQSWSSTGATIGPLASGDVDWYCYPAVEGDRLLVTATTAFTFSGATRYHPWTDPMLSLWRGARVTKLAENDDAGPGPFDARIDTGPLTAGCHCFAVSTFGDAGYTGVGQGSTGRYQLQVVMGNRPPVPSIRKGGGELPAAPTMVFMDEGDTLDLSLSWVDADHDVPTRSFAHVDGSGASVAGGTLVLGAQTGTYRWTAPPGSVAGNPYTLRLTAADAEFNRTKSVLVVVRGVNRAPPTPVLEAPIAGAVVATGAPALSWANVVDPEGDPVSYDVEVYHGTDTDRLPDQTATVAAAMGASTSFTPSTIPENTRVTWRVRAKDNHPGGLSPWSGYERFLIDVANDAPPVPDLIKPGEGEVVPQRRPGVSALDVDDPEGDDLTYTFAIARDLDFTQVVWTSAPVAVDAMSITTMASTGVDLVWGDTYFARVRAEDDRGGQSAWSPPHRFRLTVNLPPTTPALTGGCVAAIYRDAPPTEIVVDNAIDPEREALTFELEVFAWDDDPRTAAPVYRTTAPMAAGAMTTAIPVELSSLPNGHYRYQVRAHDGSDPSDWVSCELTLDLPEGSEDGGCCDGGGARASWPPLLLVGLWLVARRRRAATSPAS